MISKKRAIGITALLLAVLIITLLGNMKYESVMSSAGVDTKPQIILDAGHGGLTNTID